MSQTTHPFRIRAMSAEDLARAARDPATRREWEQIAIAWHALASREDPACPTDDLVAVDSAIDIAAGEQITQ